MAERKSGGSIWDSVRTIIYAILIALVIRTLAYEPFNIPSGSMIPALRVGDYLFVSKYSYGYSRYSLPLSLPLLSGRVLYSRPERGDIAVFKLPTDNKTDYIKRIVGLPGDRIQVVGGTLYINGAALPREPIESFSQRARDGRYRTFPQFIETMPNGMRYKVIEARGNGAELDNTRVFSVPANHFFVMGDNRDNSQDSRAFLQVGFVPAENLIGRAEFIFFSERCGGQPGDRDCHWWQVWKWPQAIRWNRLFQSIE